MIETLCFAIGMLVGGGIVWLRRERGRTRFRTAKRADPHRDRDAYPLW